MNSCLNFNLDAPLGSFDTILEQRSTAVSSDTETIIIDFKYFLHFRNLREATEKENKKNEIQISYQGDYIV